MLICGLSPPLEPPLEAGLADASPVFTVELGPSASAIWSSRSFSTWPFETSTR